MRCFTRCTPMIPWRPVTSILIRNPLPLIRRQRITTWPWRITAGERAARPLSRTGSPRSRDEVRALAHLETDRSRPQSCTLPRRDASRTRSRAWATFRIERGCSSSWARGGSRASVRGPRSMAPDRIKLRAVFADAGPCPRRAVTDHGLAPSTFMMPSSA